MQFIVVIVIVVAILMFLKNRTIVARRMMNNWFIERGCQLQNVKYKFFYVVKEVRYSPYQQLLYEVEFIDSRGVTHNEIFIVGNWFFGLMKDELWCSWTPDSFSKD